MLVLSCVEFIMEVDKLWVWFFVKKGLFKWMVDYIKVVDDVSFIIKCGYILGIVGESGLGKIMLV